MHEHESMSRCRFCVKDAEAQVLQPWVVHIGNAIKYLWRAGLKQDADKTPIEKQIEDLRKAIWYIEDEIKTLECKKSEGDS